MVLPVGPEGVQRLVRAERTGEDEVTATEVMAVQFTELETGP